MKRFKRIVPLLMAGAMLVSPVSISAQAKNVDNNKRESAQTTVTARAYSSPALIKGDNVALRSDASLSATILRRLHNNYSIRVDKNGAKYNKDDKLWWYPCQYGNTYGYVAAKYVYIIPA